MKAPKFLCIGFVTILASLAAQAQNTSGLAAISATHYKAVKQEIIAQSEGSPMELAKFAINHTEQPGGAASRIIDGLYLHTEQGEMLEVSTMPEIEIQHSPKDSYLFIRGTIHAGGQDYHAVAPKLSSLDQQLREFAPDECGIYLIGDTQLKHENHFLVKYLFEDTLNNVICWDYFLSLNSFAFSEDVVDLIEYNLQFNPPEIAAIDSGPSRVHVGPLIPHLQMTDDR